MVSRFIGGSPSEGPRGWTLAEGARSPWRRGAPSPSPWLLGRAAGNGRLHGVCPAAGGVAAAADLEVQGCPPETAPKRVGSNAPGAMRGNSVPWARRHQALRSGTWATRPRRRCRAWPWVSEGDSRAARAHETAPSRAAETQGPSATATVPHLGTGSGTSLCRRRAPRSPRHTSFLN